MRRALGILAAVLLVFGLSGCLASTVSENAKQLNQINREAGKFVESSAQDPAVVQAGSDIAANAETLMVTLGSPEAPVEYTPEVAETTREVVKEEGATSQEILETIGGVVKGIPYAGEALFGVIALIAAMQRRKSQQKLIAVYRGVGAVKSDLAKEDGTRNYADAITNTLRTTAALSGLYKDIKTDLAKLRSKGEVV